MAPFLIGRTHDRPYRPCPSRAGRNDAVAPAGADLALARSWLSDADRLIESNQNQIEVDEPEDDQMALLMGADDDKPADDDMSEEKLLRALLEAQRQG